MIEFLLLFVAITLLIIIIPLVSTYQIVKSIIHQDYRGLVVWFYGTARAIDILGNVISANMFNDILIKSKGYKFGRRGETLSSVIGKNHRDNTLTWTGSVIRKTLDSIDTNHTLKSILSDEEINRRK
jgi:hypothetical protein